MDKRTPKTLSVSFQKVVKHVLGDHFNFTVSHNMADYMTIPAYGKRKPAPRQITTGFGS
jgi:hypothetical protein